MRILAVLFLGITCAAAQPQCSPPSEDDIAYLQVLAALDAFSINLYQELVRDWVGNVVLSPLSAAVVLALTYEGARGRTAQQLGDALHLPLSRQRVADGFRQLIDTLPTSANQSDDSAVFRLANRIYIQNGFDVEATFLQTAVEDFRSGVQALNFAANAENARNIINEWVANFTEDKITGIIPSGALTENTRLVLVNALYFSASWLLQFQESATTVEAFYVSENEHVNASMMNGAFELNYADLPECKAKALKLPYKAEGDFQSDLLILLPNEKGGLDNLERNLGQLIISNIQFQNRQVEVTLPKFTIESTIQMREKLQELGVDDLFTTQADLTGITDPSLSVSEVIQKAYIKVDENGTEAAAATAVIIRVTSSVQIPPIPPIKFNVDHPFLFLLLTNNRISFIGRVTNPNE